MRGAKGPALTARPRTRPRRYKGEDGDPFGGASPVNLVDQATHYCSVFPPRTLNVIYLKVPQTFEKDMRGNRITAEGRQTTGAVLSARQRAAFVDATETAGMTCFVVLAEIPFVGDSPEHGY